MFPLLLLIVEFTFTINIFILLIMFKGELHPNQQLAWVVLYLKIINFLKTDAYILVQ